MDRKKETGKELEVYLHIPFCVKKCSYCDFLSGPASEQTKRQYFQALRREIQAAAFELQDKTITSIFLGGGTPSLSPYGEIEETLKLLSDFSSFAQDIEISLEANPGTVTAEKLLEYRRAGVNRLSLGCQSVHETELKRLGRIHSFSQFLESFSLAREAGFTNINVDLMSGLPNQTLPLWEESLRTIAELSPEHISAYSLILEEGTPFYDEELLLPDEDTEREMYHRTKQLLAGCGYEQYEISNYARPGYLCRHNMGYWRRTPYLGFGIGAASLFGEERFTNESNLEIYLQNSGNLKKIRKNRESIETEEQIEETMILGLRTIEGVNVQKFQDNFGKPLEHYYGTIIEKYRAGDFLEYQNGYLHLTDRGIDVSNPILADFLLT